MISSFYAAIAAMALVYLSIRVVRLRRKRRVSIGSGGHPDLERAMRVHGNFIEYTPLMLVLLILAEMQGLTVWVVHLFGVSILASRLTHFFGIHSDEAPAGFRVYGMSLTFANLVFLAVILLVQFAGRAV